jgi:hypothetical protein
MGRDAPHPRRPHSHGFPVLIPVLVAAAVAGGVAVGGLTGLPGQDPPAVPRAEVGGAPIGIAATPGLVWVVDRRSTRIRVFDARSLTPAGGGFRPRVPPTAVPVGITATPKRVWVAYAHPTDARGWLARVAEGGRRVHVTPLSTAPAAISPGEGDTLTIVDRRGGVMRFSGGRAGAVLGPPARASSADGRDGTWVVAAPGSGESKILLQLRLRLRIAMPGAAASDVVAGAGGAWIPGGCGRSLAWADAAAARLRCTGVPATLVAPGRSGGAWAVVGRHDLLRIDTAGGESARWRLPLAPTSIAVRGDTAWLASERGRLARVDAAPANPGDAH